MSICNIHLDGCLIEIDTVSKKGKAYYCDESGCEVSGDISWDDLVTLRNDLIRILTIPLMREKSVQDFVKALDAQGVSQMDKDILLMQLAAIRCRRSSDGRTSPAEDESGKEE